MESNWIEPQHVDARLTEESQLPPSVNAGSQHSISTVAMTTR